MSQTLTQEPTRIQHQCTTKDKSDGTISRSTTPSLDTRKNSYVLGLNHPPLTAIGRELSHFPLPKPTLPLNPFPSNPSDSAVANTLAPKTTLKTKTKTKSKARTSSLTRSVNELRRLRLACTFCRERKIACGQPPNGSPDPTCK